MTFLDRLTGPDASRNLFDALSCQRLLKNDRGAINAIIEKGQVSGFIAGDVLMIEGATERHISFILAGETTIRVNGRVVARRSAGTHIGEMALIDPSVARSATVEAANEVVVLSVEESDFSEIANSFTFLWKGIATEIADRLRQRNSFIQPDKRLVILVHGIRTRAEWQDMVCKELSGESTKLVPIKYGFLDAFRFWCPIWTRLKAVDEIQSKISRAMHQHPGFEIIVIAHSFGTYAITEILKRNPLIQISRLILCGGIVPNSFEWHKISHRPMLIVNDCGSEDIWPVLARSCSWGYGSSGVYGFGTPEVQDRFSKKSHSGFFEEGFVREYWKPFVDSGVVCKTEANRESSPYWKSALDATPLQWIIVLISVTIFLLMILQLKSD
ncbi:MAG: cyclic nucleotide-binding domain-containing protein [Verrucomicrobiota bacterium]